MNLIKSLLAYTKPDTTKEISKGYSFYLNYVFKHNTFDRLISLKHDAIVDTNYTIASGRQDTTTSFTAYDKNDYLKGILTPVTLEYTQLNKLNQIDPYSEYIKNVEYPGLINYIPVELFKLLPKNVSYEVYRCAKYKGIMSISVLFPHEKNTIHIRLLLPCTVETSKEIQANFEKQVFG